MTNGKILASIFLILALVSISCDARARNEDWRNMKLEEFVDKRSCRNTGETCETTTDCCGGEHGCVSCDTSNILCSTLGIGCSGYFARHVCYNRNGRNDGYVINGVTYYCRDRFKDPHHDRE